MRGAGYAFDERFAAMFEEIRCKVSQTAFEDRPFLCAQAMAPPVDYYPDHWLPIYDERIETRRRELPVPEARDLAIAHAQVTARSMVIHSETGELLLPSIGPVILGAARPLRVLAYSGRNPKLGHMQGQMFSALEMEQAIAFNDRLWDGLERARPLQTITVLRGDAVTWDSAAASLVSTAALLGLDENLAHESHRVLGTTDHVASWAVNEVFGREPAENDMEAFVRRAMFSDPRTPCREALEISYRAVEHAIATQRNLAMDFSGYGIFTDTRAVLSLRLLQERCQHLGLGVDRDLQTPLPHAGY